MINSDQIKHFLLSGTYYGSIEYVRYYEREDMGKIFDIENMPRIIPLEEAAEKVCQEAEKPPFIYQLPPQEGRKILDQAQNIPVYKYPAEIRNTYLELAEWGTVMLYSVIPEKIQGTPSVIYYLHGGGWVLGNFHTHEKLVRELAARTNSVVFFPEYSLSPEAKYPTAMEQCYAILNLLPEIAQVNGWNLNFETLTVAGDSAGGNLATVMTILSKYRRGLKIDKQLLYYPVTNAYFDTPSYHMFAKNYYLTRDGMIWFWNQYTCSCQEQSQITASPLQLTIGDLEGLPPAMIINGEADVLRDEGEAYARRLREAGGDVTAIRFQAIIHDFVMLNSLDQTRACRAAMDVSTVWINRKNCIEN